MTLGEAIEEHSPVTVRPMYTLDFGLFVAFFDNLLN
jgi:hypothetical protein